MMANYGVCQAVVAIANQYRDWSGQAIGDLVGVSRERVRQILGNRQLVRRCGKCGSQIHARDGHCYEKGYCPRCWALEKERRRDARRVRYTCIVCGKPYFLQKSKVNYLRRTRRHFTGFCAKVYQGRYIGVTHQR